ncbi:MAG: hypothetical protein HC915_07910 [Anaerolineae bacterium]|nr:hypothetical protein [Anaerolineae bacterium]
MPPQVVIAQGWRAVLNESFATAANGWTNANNSQPLPVRRGELWLAAGVRAQPRAVQPAILLAEGFWGWRAEWQVLEPEARLILNVQETEAGALQVRWAPDGHVEVIRWGVEAAPLVLGRAQAQTSLSLTFGVWLAQGQLTVFQGEAALLRVLVPVGEAGGFSLALEGTGAVVSVARFELSRPD